MAWVGQEWRRLGLGLGLGGTLWGCSAPNAAYDDAAAASEGEADGSGSSGAASTGEPTEPPADGTTDDGTTAPEPVECTEPVEGTKVVVEPLGGAPKRQCGAAHTSRGLLANDGAYQLYGDPQCLPNEATQMIFAPKGPPLSNGDSTCVDYKLAYRPDCSLDWAVMIDPGGLLFMASTSPVSPEPDLLTIHPVAQPGVCNCSAAATGSCCANVDLDVGLYALSLRVAGSEEELVVTQGSQLNLTIGDREYEFVVPQARVSRDCQDPMQFDWFIRRLAL